MDIYKYAEESNKDYYDSKLGRIYRVKDYNDALKEKKSTDGIEMYSITGNYLGIAKRES